jgi:hypothetical protein
LSTLVCVLATAIGCSNESKFDKGMLEAKTSPQLNAARAENEKSFESQRNYTREQLEKALRVVSSTLINRDPTTAELENLSRGLSGYEDTIKAYFNDPGFKTVQMAYYRSIFEMQGTDQGTNYDEPSNLALYLITNDINFQDIIRADYCVNNNLEKTGCSSFGNDANVARAQAAGALTTQAFMRKWSASFNFKRVAKSFKVFACSEYPDSTDAGLTEQQVADSIKDFNCTTCTPACYSCHRSMNSKAALFYNFNQLGVYSTNTTNTTVTDTGAASNIGHVLKSGVRPQYHGREMQTVREYALLLTQNKKFRDCLAQRLTNYMMGREPYAPLLPQFQNVRDNVSFNDFKVKSILLEVAKHPAFVLR